MIALQESRDAQAAVDQLAIHQARTTHPPHKPLSTALAIRVNSLKRPVDDAAGNVSKAKHAIAALRYKQSDLEQAISELSAIELAEMPAAKVA